MGQAYLAALMTAGMVASVMAGCGTTAPAPNNSGSGGSHISTTKKSGVKHKTPSSGGTKSHTKATGKTSGTSLGGSLSNKRSQSHSTTGGSAPGAKGGMSGQMMAAGAGAGKKSHSSRKKPQRMTGSASSTTTTKPISLTTLPKVTAVAPFNPDWKSYHEISSFINEMGYHWQTQVPGMVYMTNQDNQITGVETTFPQSLGDFSWYDPPTPPTILNASLAMYSEHLYFVPEVSITPSMSATMPDALNSWATFVANNPRLKVYVKEPRTYRGFTVYGPPNGPGIEVLVGKSGLISGFMVAEPATWGYSPLYVKTAPFPPKVYSKSYFSVILLEPPATGTPTTKTS